MSKNRTRKNTSKKDVLSTNLSESTVDLMIAEPKVEESVNEESFTDQIQMILKEENLITQPVKDDKKNLRKYLSDLISEKKYSQKEILTLSSTEFPHLLKATISTILSDSKNAKYNKFDYLVVVVEGIYQFSDVKNEKISK